MDTPGVPCPCCRILTLSERNAFEVCPVCFWEDDGQDDVDADQIRGGPNRSLSLTEARRNFRAFGACDETVKAFVRFPNSDEMPGKAQPQLQPTPAKTASAAEPEGDMRRARIN